MARRHYSGPPHFIHLPHSICGCIGGDRHYVPHLGHSYTKRSTVSGHLVPDSGLVKVYVPQPGIVLEKRVAEGQHVKQGDVLYVLSSERQSSTQGNTQVAISNQVEIRQQSLREELEKTRLIQKDERDALVKKSPACKRSY